MSLHNYKKISPYFVVVLLVKFLRYKTIINEAVAVPEGYLSGHKDGQIDNRQVNIVLNLYVWTVTLTSPINILIILKPNETAKLYNFNDIRRLLSS